MGADQTARTRRLVCSFAVCMVTLVRFLLTGRFFNVRKCPLNPMLTAMTLIIDQQGWSGPVFRLAKVSVTQKG